MTLLSDRDLYAGRFGLPLSARYQHGEDDIRRALEEVRQQHPLLTLSEAEGRALARLDARVYAQQPKTLITKRHNWRRWLQIGAFALVSLLCLLFGVQAHCQIDVIQFQDNAGVTQATFAAPFKFKAGSNCSVARSGSVLTFNCTGGAAAAGGTNSQVQWNNATALAGISTMTTDGTIVTAKVGTSWLFADPTDATKKVQLDASGITTATTRTVAFPDANSRTIKNGSSTGQIPIWNNATSTFDVSDPLVQGTQAAGSTTIPNPVVIGGSDFGGTPAVRLAKVDSSGNLFVGNFPATQPVSGTFWQATQPVSGTFWQATQPVSGTFWQATQPVSIADGSDTTLGAKTDAKSTATDVTSVSAMSVLKQISASVQAPPSQAVTNAGTFAVQAATAIADGADSTLGAKADAKSTATDVTAISVMSVLKEISAMAQAPASTPVTGTFWQTTQPIAGTAADNSANSTLKNPTIPCRANAAAPSWTEGNQVPCSADLEGNARTLLADVNGALGTISHPLYVTSLPALFSLQRTPAIQTATMQLVSPLGVPLGTPSSPMSVAPANNSGCAGSSPAITSSKAINISTITTAIIVPNAGSLTTYICSLDLVAAAADNLALFYGTGTTCGTGSVGLAGGTTAATGWNLAANGGLTKGTGQGVLWKVPPGNDICVITSAAVQASGSVTIAQF